MNEELRKLLFEYFSAEYSPEEIETMLNRSKIEPMGNRITLTYHNGIKEVVELQYKPYLVQISCDKPDEITTSIN